MNSTEPSAKIVGFVQQTGERDTLSLLFSCLLTLGLCVYTAVHLNVPARGEKYWISFCRELKWCVIGLFGPEYVVFAAWRQWSSAWQLQHIVNEDLGRRDSEATAMTTDAHGIEDLNKKTNLEPKWTIVHGFYGSMGGFVINIEDVPDPAIKRIFGNRTRLTLTARGAALIACCTGLPYITRADIMDKNKADTVAKILVCLQAGWFTVQVFARLAANLPATLLEVNTLGHIAIAFVMYLLWWHKPRQIREPTKLQGENMAPLLAFMFMTSKLSGKEHRQLPYHKCEEDAEMGTLVFRRRDSIIPGSELVKESIGEQKKTILRGYFHHTKLGELLSEDVEAEHDRSHWALAAQAVETYPALSDKLRCTMHNRGACAGCNVFQIQMEELLVYTTTDWPTDELLRRVDSLIMGVILWGATIVYGAIHTAAWNAYFPTVVEKWMWHSSSVWVAFSGAVWVIINGIAKILPHIDRVWIKFLQRKTHWLFDTVVLMLCLFCGIAYIFSRGFLVIEAFISLRKLPAAAYQTPSWLQVLPHL